MANDKQEVVTLLLDVPLVNHCKDYSHFDVTGKHSDGFDHGEDWHCKNACRPIQGYVEWHDKVKIPDWCPLRLTHNNDVMQDIIPQEALDDLATLYDLVKIKYGNLDPTVWKFLQGVDKKYFPKETE